MPSRGLGAFAVPSSSPTCRHASSGMISTAVWTKTGTSLSSYSLSGMACLL